MSFLRFVVFALLFVAPLLANSTGERIYFSMHAYQKDGFFIRNAPRFSHSWLVAYKCPANVYDLKLCQSLPISWFAANERASIFSGVHQGRLYSHQETLNLAARMGSSVGQLCTYQSVRLSNTCVYEVTPRFWDLALQQYSKLSNLARSGTGYKMLDSVASRSGQYPLLNCIHAVTDIAILDGHSFLDTKTQRGFDASYSAMQYLLNRYSATSYRPSVPAPLPAVATHTPVKPATPMFSAPSATPTKVVAPAKLDSTLQQWARQGGDIENGLPKITIGKIHPPTVIGQIYLICHQGQSKRWQYIGNGRYQKA